MKQLAFFVDVSACSGCKTCQMACKDKHDLPVGQLWRRVYEVAGGGWQANGAAWVPSVVAYHLSVGCNHCEQPICVEVCPSGAARKRQDGIVTIDSERCLGCRYCRWACPYGAPQYDERRGVMAKCHLCHDEIDAGRQPACVSACPMRALEIGDLAEIRSQHGATADTYPLPPVGLTNPALVVKPHPGAGTIDRRSLSIINREEVGHEGR
jgi:anaerobic dimethyl sulfoxide reductase subunit B (iron-sulfur subunit)